MHLGNGTITVECAALGLAGAAAGIGLAMMAARRQTAERRVSPIAVALGTSLVFAAQSFNVPVLPGASGHLVGGFLLAYLVGPAWATLAMAILLAAQSVLFADGGNAALGVNILTMGVVPALVVFPLWERFFGRTRGAARYASLAAGAWCSTVLAAAVCSLALLSQPEAQRHAGALLATMLGVHSVIGLVEAAATLLVVALAVRLAHAPAPVLQAGAVLAAVALCFAGAFGASPWPDGLEFSLEKLGLHGLMESAQWSLWADYSLLPTVLATFAVGGAALVVARLFKSALSRNGGLQS